MTKYHGILLIIILVLSTLVRLAYIDYAGGSVILEPDSQGYYSAGNFFTKDLIHNVFNTNRLPGYTMLTSFAMSVSGVGHPPYQSPAFFTGARLIIIVQTIAGLIGLIVLYDTLITLRVSRRISLLFTALTGFNIYQFSWERAFLTEALYIASFIVVMRLFVSLVKKPTRGKGAIFIAFSIAGFLLRPAGLLIPYLLLPVIWYIHRTRNVFFLIFTLLVAYTLVPLTFITMNRFLYNFRGLSFNTDFAVFGRILQKNIPTDAAAGASDLQSKVEEYRKNGGTMRIPWYFFVAYNNEIYGRLPDVQEFNRLVLRDQWPAFTATVVGDIPKAFFDTYVEEVIYRASHPSISRMFFDAITWIVQQIQKATIVFLILFPLSVWQWIKKQTPVHTFLLAVGVIELYQIFSSLIWGGAWEYARHIITTQTYLFFFCFWWIAKIGKTILWRRN